MGVFSNVKKMPRRVKKAIRRSVSGVCMVSAIIVALVPAKPTQGYVAPGTNTLSDYSYGVEASDVTPSAILDSGTVDLTLYSSGAITDTSVGTIHPGEPDVYKVLKVKQLSDGTYNVNWQFKMYLQSLNETDMGVICQYNSTYQAGTVEIDPTMPYEYCVVESDYYDAFFNAFSVAKDVSHANYPTFTLLDGSSYTPASGKALQTKWTISSVAVSYDNTYDQYWIEKYFPTEYSTWVLNKNAYNTYLINYANWENSTSQNGTVAPPNEVSDPGDLTCYVSDMTDANRYKYFCVANPDYKGYLTAEEYTLVKVADSRNGSTGAVINYCYMPKGSSNVYDNDEFGFHINEKTYVIAVGSQAFKETTNVEQLDLCSEIKYIGDEAFLDSFVRGVTFHNVRNIGNRAFKGCSQLVSINLKDGAVNIGTEAFYGCGFTTLTFPYSIEYIGRGAFANCSKLAVIDFSKITRDNCEIDDYAFFNDVRLNSITFSDTISRIGECAFACTMSVSGFMLEFEFPEHIEGETIRKIDGTIANGIGNFVLAGRTNLERVTMPADYGKSSEAELPYGVFYNCVGLKVVNFPTSGGACGYVNFQRLHYADDSEGHPLYRTVFDTVMTPDFYVFGPEKNMAGGTAYPRKSTWGLKSALGNDIPYVYIDSQGIEQYEISDGKYILIIDDEGILQSCNFASDEAQAEAQAYGLDLTIPENVGNTKVVGVSSECFDDTTIHNVIKTITIANNSISEIAPEAFKNCPRLERVSIGNSVTKIGASAFENCPNLTYVNFETPAEGYDKFPVENIGENAFSTGAKSLIFEGDIDKNYGPFVWATDVNNYVDAEEGIRVCYYTGAPTYLTVIVDNRNGLATLLDYPHYDQLNEHSNTVGDEHPLTERYEKLGQEDVSGTEVLYTYEISLAEEKLINAVLYVDVPAGVESIDAKGFITNTSKEDPSITGIHTNNKNVFTYIGNESSPVYSKYYRTYRENGLFNGYYGDFSDSVTSEAQEYADTDILSISYETEPIGNDRIESLNLNTIEYLPENAFYSCEKLNKITLGDSLTDMEAAPFAGCTNLTSIGSTTDDFICNNGIVYSKNPDGYYNIVEVLSSRGSLVGSQKIKVGEEDPLLAEVSTVSDGAFENCKSISGIDLRGMEKLTELPDKTFKECSKLNQVIIPENITVIGHDAFAGCMEGIEIVCYGREVFLPSDAFGSAEDGDLVKSKRVISYSDSAVRKSARDLGADVSDVLDDTVKVQFFDYDGSELSDIIYVVVGGSVALEDIPQDPVRAGYVFDGWNKPLKDLKQDTVVVATYKLTSEAIAGTYKVQFFDHDGTPLSNVIYVPSGQSVKLEDIPANPTREGYTFTGWNRSLINILQDTVVIAQYSNNNGTGTGTGTGGTSGGPLYTLTVTNGNGSGSYAAGATVIITCTNPPAGKEFSKWTTDDNDLAIASVRVAATTLTMPAHNATVRATFTNKETVSGNTGTSVKPIDTSSGSSVIISKPGFSNTNLAAAEVTGSMDNYIIRITETAAATAAVEKALTAQYGSLDDLRYSAMDITLYDSTGTKKITNYSGLSITITIPVPDILLPYAGNNKAACVINEKLSKLNPKFTSIDGVPCMTFTATHFSPYVIYVDTGNLSGGTIIDETPKTGDGIAPKWFLVFGLASISIALFFIKDKKAIV